MWHKPWSRKTKTPKKVDTGEAMRTPVPRRPWAEACHCRVWSVHQEVVSSSRGGQSIRVWSVHHDGEGTAARAWTNWLYYIRGRKERWMLRGTGLPSPLLQSRLQAHWRVWIPFVLSLPLSTEETALRNSELLVYMHRLLQVWPL